MVSAFQKKTAPTKRNSNSNSNNNNHNNHKINHTIKTAPTTKLKHTIAYQQPTQRRDKLVNKYELTAR